MNLHSCKKDTRYCKSMLVHKGRWSIYSIANFYHCKLLIVETLINYTMYFYHIFPPLIPNSQNQVTRKTNRYVTVTLNVKNKKMVKTAFWQHTHSTPITGLMPNIVLRILNYLLLVSSQNFVQNITN